MANLLLRKAPYYAYDEAPSDEGDGPSQSGSN
jgi:hypothetical protein